MKSFWRKLRTAILGSFFLTFVGCASNLGSFTILATKNVDLANFSTKAAEDAPTVTGYDIYATICIFPLGTPNLKEATDRAEEKANAFGLTNARITASGWDIPYIYGEEGYTVTGNPIQHQ